MYVETLLNLPTNPSNVAKRLTQHFFKPYESKTTWLLGAFYPLDAVFEETFPNLILTTLLVGQAIFSTLSTVGSLLLLNMKDARSEAYLTLNSLLLASVTLSIAMAAPFFEAMRFMTRWGATLSQNTLSTPKPKTNNAANSEIKENTQTATMKM